MKNLLENELESTKRWIETTSPKELIENIKAILFYSSLGTLKNVNAFYYKMEWKYYKPSNMLIIFIAIVEKEGGVKVKSIVMMLIS